MGSFSRAVYVDTARADRHDGPARLRDAGYTVDEAIALTPGEVSNAARDAQVVLLGDSPFTEDVFSSLPDLLLVSAVTVGVDHVDLDAARAHGVWVANTPGAVTEEVAVTAFAMALSLVRHLPFLDRHVRAGGWDAFSTGPRRRPSTLTLGIVGLGRTGSRLAEIARAVFGGIVGSDLLPVGPVPEGLEVVPIDELVARADVISLHLPAERGAPPLVDADLLAKIKPGSFLVNVSRGSLVDTAAVLAALDSGRLAGAALDVVDGEPPDVDAEIRTHPRVLVTPHAAFYSSESEAAACAHQAENVIAWARTGRPLTPVVEGRTR